jgi:hypothetical protein
MTSAERAEPSGSESVSRAYLDEARRQLRAAAEKIEHCVNQLTDEQVWWRPTQPQNSIANLILHLCGNVRQWIVAGLGGEPDTRRRAEEFAERAPIPKAELLNRIRETLRAADRTLAELSPEKLLGPRRIQGFETNGLSAIFDSVSHFKGHTQEIICLTRMQLGDRYRFDWVPSTPEQGAG